MDPKKGNYSYNLETIHIYIYILQKREIKVGDKVAGRHGNKGIISKFFLDRICLICKMEDPLIWSSIH